MTTAEYLERIAQRAEQSECTVCPEWVIQCAHFEGKIALLTERVPETVHNLSGPDAPRYCVGMIRGAWQACPCHGMPIITPLTQNIGRSLDTDSLPEARAEFDRRAQELSHA